MTLPLPFAAAAPLTVTALNEQLRDKISELPGVRVQGEVSRVSQQGGHIYFDLKDGGSKVSVKVWRTAAARLRTQPREGMQVVCSGRVEVYVPWGGYSLICSDVEPAGQGALFAALQQLKERLAREGLFDAERKQPLPFLPRTVALVTSPTGAAVRDMLRIISDRFPVRILVVPAKVQGDGAAESIARAIETIDALGWADVIIAGRGGGSVEDLWAFNEERAVRAVAACRTPIVSAVGHEIDTVLTDLAADWRAPTPTAAAEKVVPRLVDLQFALDQLQQRALGVVTRQLSGERRHLAQLRVRLGDGGAITGQAQMRLADAQARAARALDKHLQGQRRLLEGLLRRLHAAHPLRRLAEQRRRLQLVQLRMRQAMVQMQGQCRQRLVNRTSVLQALSPTAALGRGYAIVRQSDGRPLGRAAETACGEPISVLLADGQLACRVERVDLA